jgi:hypothetical protein
LIVGYENGSIIVIDLKCSIACCGCDINCAIVIE